MALKHDNNKFNISLAEARRIREALRVMGIPVAEIVLNPNSSAGSAIKLPERNIPEDGELHLEFRFDGATQIDLNVVTAREMVAAGGIEGKADLAGLQGLHKVVYPHASPQEYWGRLCGNEAVQVLCQKYVQTEWAKTVLGLEENKELPTAPVVSEPTGEQGPRGSGRVAKKATKRAVKKVGGGKK